MLNSPLTPLAIGAAYVAMTAARSVWLMRSTGVSGYVIDGGDALHRFVGQVFAVVVATLFLYFAAAAVWPDVPARVGLLTWLISDATRAEAYRAYCRRVRRWI